MLLLYVAARSTLTLHQIFKDGTLFFSGATPNLAQVIPAIDQVDRHLATVSTLHHKYDSAIRVACGLASSTLNKYYSYTDFSVAYRIATSTSYFISSARPHSSQLAGD